MDTGKARRLGLRRPAPDEVRATSRRAVRGPGTQPGAQAADPCSAARRRLARRTHTLQPVLRAAAGPIGWTGSRSGRVPFGPRCRPSSRIPESNQIEHRPRSDRRGRPGTTAYTLDPFRFVPRVMDGVDRIAQTSGTMPTGDLDRCVTRSSTRRSPEHTRTSGRLERSTARSKPASHLPPAGRDQDPVMLQMDFAPEALSRRRGQLGSSAAPRATRAVQEFIETRRRDGCLARDVDRPTP